MLAQHPEHQAAHIYSSQPAQIYTKLQNAIHCKLAVAHVFQWPTRASEKKLPMIVLKMCSLSEHQSGHRRRSTLFNFVLGMMLIIVCCEIDVFIDQNIAYLQGWSKHCLFLRDCFVFDKTIACAPRLAKHWPMLRDYISMAQNTANYLENCRNIAYYFGVCIFI